MATMLATSAAPDIDSVAIRSTMRGAIATALPRPWDSRSRAVSELQNPRVCQIGKPPFGTATFGQSPMYTARLAQ